MTSTLHPVHDACMEPPCASHRCAAIRPRCVAARARSRATASARPASGASSARARPPSRPSMRSPRRTCQGLDPQPSEGREGWRVASKGLARCAGGWRAPWPMVAARVAAVSTGLRVQRISRRRTPSEETLAEEVAIVPDGPGCMAGHGGGSAWRLTLRGVVAGGVRSEVVRAARSTWASCRARSRSARLHRARCRLAVAWLGLG